MRAAALVWYRRWSQATTRWVSQSKSNNGDVPQFWHVTLFAAGGKLEAEAEIESGELLWPPVRHGALGVRGMKGEAETYRMME